MEDKEKNTQNQEELESALEETQLDEYMFEPVILNIGEVEGLPYDTNEFTKGISEASRVAGMITALKNTGLPWTLVMDYIFNKETMEFNLKLADKNSETSIKVAEKQQINLDKTQL